LAISRIDAIIFDFDGVLTNNQVIVDENGKEAVICSRSDGLAFDRLRKTKMKVFILSTETNPVVSRRAEKLKVPVFQGAKDKRIAVNDLCKAENLSASRILFVGNDMNDYESMQMCGFSACPADSHKSIRAIATFRLKSKGGEGVARELVEGVLGMDFM